MKETYYKCPKCGELTTETELLDRCGSSGLPYCYCEYVPNRVYVGYERITKKEWLRLKMKKKITRKAKVLNKGIVNYIQSLEKEQYTIQEIKDMPDCIDKNKKLVFVDMLKKKLKELKK